jgi:hypothetical protein
MEEAAYLRAASFAGIGPIGSNPDQSIGGRIEATPLNVRTNRPWRKVGAVTGVVVTAAG